MSEWEFAARMFGFLVIGFFMGRHWEKNYSRKDKGKVIKCHKE